MHPVLAYSQMLELFGPTVLRFPAGRLIALIGACSWEASFLKLARLAAIIANSAEGPHSARVHAATTELLASTLESANPEERVIAFYVRVNAPRIVAHEEVIYFLQALAILYGRDEGPAPSDGQLAFWMLAGNDHCFDWREDSGDLSTVEDLTASTARYLLFNHQDDMRRQLVRSVAMFERPPPRTPGWTEPDDWHAFQTRAFGTSFDDYIDSLAGPLHFLSAGWGDENNASIAEPVAPDPRVLGLEERPDLVQGFLDRVSATREEFRESLASFVCDDGLPRGSAPFFLKPMARFAAGASVAASPWVVREQVRGALWARHLDQAKHDWGKKAGADRWLSAFGDLFELWCRDVARWAEMSEMFRGRLLMSKSIGDPDEIEDVVLVDGDRVLLASAKARAVRQELLKGALDAGKMVSWFEEFLFRRRSDNQRDGAIRLLDKTVSAIRDGAHVDQGLSPTCKIFPMLVTYDHFGADNPGFYMWCADRCEAEHLLQQSNVAPAVIVRVERFEQLMSLAAAGGDVFAAIERRRPQERMDVALYDATKDVPFKRLPEIERRFQAITDRIQRRLRETAEKTQRSP